MTSQTREQVTWFQNQAFAHCSRASGNVKIKRETSETPQAPDTTAVREQRNINEQNKSSPNQSNTDVCDNIKAFALTLQHDI